MPFDSSLTNVVDSSGAYTQELAGNYILNIRNSIYKITLYIYGVSSPGACDSCTYDIFVSTTLLNFEDI